MARNGTHIELLPARILFDRAGWTTFEINDPTEFGDAAYASIPVTIEIQPLARDPRLGQRVLKLAGTPGDDVHHITTTTQFIHEPQITNYIAFGYGDHVAETAIYRGDDDPTLDSYWWCFRLNEWMKQATYHGWQPVLTGTYGNTRFYAPIETDLIVADTGGGNDLIDIDPAIKIKTQIAAGRGDDIVFGGGGYAYISGGEGADKLYARGTSSDLFGNAGSDQLVGGWGIDRLYGGGGNDRLSGGALLSSTNEDIIVGGQGIDRAVRDTGDQFESIESFF